MQDGRQKAKQQTVVRDNPAKGTESIGLREMGGLHATGAHHRSQRSTTSAATERVCVAGMNIMENRLCENSADRLVDVVRHVDVLVLEQ